MSFVRNIYSPEEQAAIDAYYERGRQFTGWMGDEPTDKEPYPIYNWSAGKEIILHQATIADYKNPLHRDPTFAPKIGIPHFYSSTLIQNSIFDFFGRLLSNWMGDDGFIRKYQWIKFTNTPFGDTVFGYGKVVRKYIDVQGHCLVDIDCWMDNARGFICNTGFSTVELLSREKMNHDKLPDWDDIPRPNPNPDGIKVGDRVRMKERPDWPLPTPHPTAGHTAKVIEAATNRDLGAYCFIAFDEDITGLDPRVVVGARYDQMEKI